MNRSKDVFALLVPITDIKGLKNEEQLFRLLKSIVHGKYEEAGWEVVLMYDACDRVFVNKFKKIFPTFTHLEHGWNRLNFARNVNIGMRYVYGQGKNVVVVNQDCILPSVDFFVETILRIPENHENIIFTAQAVNLILENLDNPSDSLNKLSKRKEFEEINGKFPFYCVYIGFEVMEQIGFLDGVYVCTFEDDDYLTRAYLKGIKVYRSGVRIYHEGSVIDTSRGDWESASGSYNQQRLGVNLMKYMTKYQIRREEVIDSDGNVDHNKLIPWILANRQFQEGMIIR